MIKRWFLLFPVILLFSCIADEDFDSPFDKISDFNFENGLNGWKGGFANYSMLLADSFDLNVEHTQLPDPYQNEGKAIRLSARNFNGELFMFLKNQVDGLKPNQAYRISYEFVFLPELINTYDQQNVENFPVVFKVGAFVGEPVSVPPVDESIADETVDLNFQPGNYNQEDGDLKVLGEFRFKDLNQEGIGQLSGFNSLNKVVNATSDGNGKLWLVIGMETNLEVEYSAYFNRIIVYYEEA